MKVKADIELTPEIMAIEFWNWDDVTQCEFFTKLREVIEMDYNTNKSAYSLGEMQWLYLGKKLNENILAKEMACALMAPIFLHATNFMETTND